MFVQITVMVLVPEYVGPTPGVTDYPYMYTMLNFLEKPLNLQWWKLYKISYFKWAFTFFAFFKLHVI